jgi:hypothetical protein
MTVLLVLVLLVILPAAAAFVSQSSLMSSATIKPVFDIGARVVYQRQEISNRPMADAHDVIPSERGEFYYNNLINFLRVTEVLDDGRILAVASDQKWFCFPPGDSHFRKPRLMERLSFRSRFPRI